MESNTQLIANVNSWKDPWKRRKLEDMRMLLKAPSTRWAKSAHAERGKKNLENVLGVLPALKKPTISPLSDGDGWRSTRSWTSHGATIIPRSKRPARRASSSIR
jgi:ATP phosphoribosyltransferase